MVDVGGGPQPQLRAALPRGEHDAEVVLARHQKVALLLARHLRYAPAQLADVFAGAPEAGIN